MVPYQNIDVNAPFSAAFLNLGMGWAAKIVSLGAVLGEARTQPGQRTGMGMGLRFMLVVHADSMAWRLRRACRPAC